MANFSKVRADMVSRQIKDRGVRDPQGSCQMDENRSLQGQDGCPLCRAELTPLSESGGAAQFEICLGSEAALHVKEVVDRGMDGEKFLQTSHAPEPQHRLFPSSKR
jgi:hypothetical protein